MKYITAYITGLSVFTFANTPHMMFFEIACTYIFGTIWAFFCRLFETFCNTPIWQSKFII